MYGQLFCNSQSTLALLFWSFSVLKVELLYNCLPHSGLEGEPLFLIRYRFLYNYKLLVPVGGRIGLHIPKGKRQRCMARQKQEYCLFIARTQQSLSLFVLSQPRLQMHHRRGIVNLQRFLDLHITFLRIILPSMEGFLVMLHLLTIQTRMTSLPKGPMQKWCCFAKLKSHLKTFWMYPRSHK